MEKLSHNNPNKIIPPEIEIRHEQHETEDSSKDRLREDSKAVNEARRTAHEMSVSSEELKVNRNLLDEDNNEQPHRHYVTKKIKQGAFNEVMVQTRTKLKPKQRKFSNFIHNDLVEKTSEVSAKTIARPNSMLGGGLLMVVGGVVMIIVSRRYGFELPLSVLLAFYVFGYLLFLFIDIIAGFVKTKKSS